MVEHLRHSAGRRGHTPGYVYAIVRQEDGAIKLGYSKNLERRLQDIRSYKANKSSRFLSWQRVGCMACAESILHMRFKHRRLAPDFFSGTEWFYIFAKEALSALAGVWS